MKRFDFAADVSKQLITLSAAIVTVAVTYFDKFLSRGVIIGFCELAAVLVLIASAAFGVLSLGAITSLVEEQEKKDESESRSGTDQDVKFISIFGTSAAKLTRVQQALFIVGLVAFSLIAIASSLLPH